MKKNWRFLLKNRANINHYEYKTWKSFRAPKYPFLTESMMIDRLLEFSAHLEGGVSLFSWISWSLSRQRPWLIFLLIDRTSRNVRWQLSGKASKPSYPWRRHHQHNDLSLFQWKNRSEEYPYKDNETSILRI